MSQQDIDLSRPMHSHGVDPLVAVEIFVHQGGGW